MTRHRDFDAEGFTLDPDAEPEEGPTFKLAGQVFRCRPAISPAMWIALPSYLGVDQAVDFIRECLADEDEVRKFDAVLASEKRIIRLRVDGGGGPKSSLHVIADWLLDRDGGGLTPFVLSKQPPSPDGQGTRRPTSGASSNSGVSASAT